MKLLKYISGHFGVTFSFHASINNLLLVLQFLIPCFIACPESLKTKTKGQPIEAPVAHKWFACLFMDPAGWKIVVHRAAVVK